MRKLQLAKACRESCRAAWTKALTIAGCVVLIACVRSVPAISLTTTPPAFVGDTRVIACFDLRDHISDLYADAYLLERGDNVSALERDAFHAAWREQLSKLGTLDRFEFSCAVSLTEPEYRCGMASNSPDALGACMNAH